MIEGDLIPDDVLSAPVSGVNLLPGPLRSQLASEDTLLVFLRHFGCTFCRETVSELRACSEADPAYPQVLFFFMGTPREGRAFMRRYWPTARAVVGSRQALLRRLRRRARQPAPDVRAGGVARQAPRRGGRPRERRARRRHLDDARRLPRARRAHRLGARSASRRRSSAVRGSCGDVAAAVS